MEAKDIIQLLRLQRHDLMNDLQIVHGYLSMGKTDKVQEKVNNIIEAFNQERMLMNINCPNFALWLIQISLEHKHIQFTHYIHTENKNLNAYDCIFTDIAKAMADYILADGLETVTGEIEIKDNDNSIELIFTLQGQAIQSKDWKSRLTEKLENVLIQVEELESVVSIIFSIPSPE